MANKARHAFGLFENVDEALQSKVINAYDILFLKDENGNPYIGWIDKDGNKVIIDNSSELAALETAIATKASAEDISVLESKLSTKVDSETVQTMIEEHTESAIEVVEF